MWQSVYYAVSVLCLIQYLCYVFQSSYYTAAVVEYGSVGNISTHGPKQVLLMNANNYVHYVTQAANSVSVT